MKMFLSGQSFFLLLTLFSPAVNAQQTKANPDSLLPVRGISMSVPRPSGLDSFIHFIETELAPRKVNTLVLWVDYHYEFRTHPELTDSFPLTKSDVRRMVKACRRNNIRIIPAIDLLGHQSWANRPNKLLQVYPQFDETPWIKMPERYVWPNADNLYCKSYCPLHPAIHAVLFDVIDELCEVFEADAFHGGMDEVFYIGEDKCPRCGGMDKAELFAGEVQRIYEHLASKGIEYWIWGDRLLDGKTTGLGIWEASFNNTYRAIDLIPKSVVICDWHYDRADKTAVYFAMKGFRVLSCPWRKTEVTAQQLGDMLAFRQQSSPEMKERFLGLLQTTWTRNDFFLKGFYASQAGADQPAAWNSFRLLFDAILKL